MVGRKIQQREPLAGWGARLEKTPRKRRRREERGAHSPVQWRAAEMDLKRWFLARLLFGRSYLHKLFVFTLISLVSMIYKRCSEESHYLPTSFSVWSLR